MKVKSKDKEALKQVRMELQFNSFCGSANICPKCGQRGNFRSILKYVSEETKREYLVCGWCNKTTINKIGE